MFQLFWQIEYEVGLQHENSSEAAVISSARNILNVPQGETGVLIEGLRPGTTYTFTVFAKFLDGTHGPPKSVGAKTLGENNKTSIPFILLNSFLKCTRKIRCWVLHSLPLKNSWCSSTMMNCYSTPLNLYKHKGNWHRLWGKMTPILPYCSAMLWLYKVCNI